MTADISTSIADWSTTASSNQPDNSDAVGPNILAENQRAIQACVRTIYNNLRDSAPQWLTSVSGVDTITASASAPAPAAYAAGQTWRFVSAGANTGAATLNISSLGAKSITKNGTTALAAGDIPSGAVVLVSYDGTQFQLLNVNAGSPASDNFINGFRLTLTSGTPVTTADVTGATTIYCTPYKGNAIALYTTSGWVIRTSAEFSLALGTLTSGKPYDVFCYDNAGTPALEFLVWTNDTTRATALIYQDGVLSKSGATTRRYLGTFYTTATTTTEDSKANRYLWNYYHRASRAMVRNDPTATWTYQTASYRQANGSASNQLNFIVGVSEDQVTASVTATVNATNNPAIAVGIGLDSTTVSSATEVEAIVCNGVNTLTPTHARYTGLPGTGKHSLVWLEYSSASGTTTWNGTNGAQLLSGITGSIPA